MLVQLGGPVKSIRPEQANKEAVRLGKQGQLLACNLASSLIFLACKL